MYLLTNEIEKEAVGEISVGCPRYLLTFWLCSISVRVCVFVCNIHSVRGHRSKERAIPEPQAKCPAAPDKPAAVYLLKMGLFSSWQIEEHFHQRYED